MIDLRDAAQQALEAWEHINKYGFVLADYDGPMEQAITALKAALEQPEQAEPVTTPPCKGMNCGAIDGRSHSLECHAEHSAAIAGGRFVPLAQTAALEQPEQEPWVKSYCGGKPNYTTPVEQEQPVANNPDPYHLSRILHELAGSASMCWEHVDRAGVFQSTQAADVVAAAIAEIRQRMKDAPPRREWQELSNGEIYTAYITATNQTLRPQDERLALAFARASEAALKEKNHE